MPYEVGGIDLTAHEPNSPIFTPRISAILVGNQTVFSICRRNEEGGTSRNNFGKKLKPGMGYLISTYRGGNENPLLGFVGDSPLELEISLNFSYDINQAFAKAITKEGDKNFSVASATYLLGSPGRATNIPNPVSIWNRHN